MYFVFVVGLVFYVPWASPLYMCIFCPCLSLTEIRDYQQSNIKIKLGIWNRKAWDRQHQHPVNVSESSIFMGQFLLFSFTVSFLLNCFSMKVCTIFTIYHKVQDLFWSLTQVLWVNFVEFVSPAASLIKQPK